MSYGHADKLNQPQPESERRGGDTPPEPPVDPALCERDDLRTALAQHDITILYQTLKNAGITQSRIAKLTGQRPSKVSEILAGRKVKDYDLLARIATGLHIPRKYMGLSYTATSDDSTYRGVATVTTPEGDLEMLRRQFEHLLAQGAAAAFGGIVPGVGKLTPNLPVPNLPVTLPARVGTADVAVIHGYTENLRTLARTHGGQARAAVALTDWADRWLTADTSDSARHAMLGALSDLHRVTACCCHDSRAGHRSLYHFARGVELATEAGDGYRAAYALRHAAMMLIDRGQPDRALKLAQLAELRLSNLPPDHPEVSTLAPWLHMVSAFALAILGRADQARSQLSRARDDWRPPGRYAQADMDLVTALTWLRLGRVDTAEAAATLSAQTFAQGSDHREGVVANLTRARLYVLTGEPTGLRMAAEAIDAVTPLQSQLARELWLEPLAIVLDTRPGSDARDLARTARQVATTRV